MNADKKQRSIALAVAIGADVVQLVFPMLFGEGVLSPFNDALDIGVCLVLTLLVGWHIAFLPTFLVEVVPIANLVPTWTAAILIALRAKRGPASMDTPAESVPGRPAPTKPVPGSIDIPGPGRGATGERE